MGLRIYPSRWTVPDPDPDVVGGRLVSLPLGTRDPKSPDMGSSDSHPERNSHSFRHPSGSVVSQSIPPVSSK